VDAKQAALLLLAMGLAFTLGLQAGRHGVGTSPPTVSAPAEPSNEARPPDERARREAAPGPRPTFAPGPEAARLRACMLRLTAELAEEEARLEEEERFADDPLAAFPRFDDERIPAEHRPEVFEARIQKVREWLARSELPRATKVGVVDCSALPCIVEIKMAFEPDHKMQEIADDREYDTALDHGLARATGYGSSAVRYGGSIDGWARQLRWWPPLERGDHPRLEQRIKDSAWGRIRELGKEDTIQGLMQVGLSRADAEDVFEASSYIPGTGP